MSNRESFLRWQKLMEGLSSRAVKVLTVIDLLYKRGIVPDYALIGSVAASFYLEALHTRDVDFVFPVSVPLDRLAPLYRELEDLGYDKIDNDGFLLIEGWPVHFLPPFNALHRKMLETAVGKPVGGNLHCKVALPEYLAADSVSMSRPEKDYGRIILLRQLPEFNQRLFLKLLREFHLEEQWQKLLPKLS